MFLHFVQVLTQGACAITVSVQRKRKHKQMVFFGVFRFQIRFSIFNFRIELLKY